MEENLSTYPTTKQPPPPIPPPMAIDQHKIPGHQFPKFISKKLAVVALVLIAITFTAGIAYQYFEQKKLKSITDFESCAAAGFPVAESYPATCRTGDGRMFTQVLSEEERKNLDPDPTAEWRTYANDDYNFSFKYPENGKIEEFPSDSPAPAVILRIPNISADLLVHVYDNFKTVNDAVNYKLDSEEKNQNYPSEYIRKNYNNGDIKGERLVSEINPNTIHNYISIYSQFDNKIYHFEFRYDNSENKEKMLLLVDQVLSTFKFTEPKLSCTPRPSCLDSNPRCLIPETDDMCPPSPTPIKDEAVFCTQDAKQCSDGSWVGRTGPNCEFVCPTN